VGEEAPGEGGQVGTGAALQGGALIQGTCLGLPVGSDGGRPIGARPQRFPVVLRGPHLPMEAQVTLHG
jgi:hypothetical protein